MRESGQRGARCELALIRWREVKPRLTVVTLGVSDLTRSRDFYEQLGWRSDSREEMGVVFFASGDMVLALWGRDELAQDSGVAPGNGWGGVTLAHNVGSPAEVDEVIVAAERAGATITRVPAETFWGGYTGVFVDPDGHPWEVAHNPHWTLTADGGVVMGTRES
jgi:catechol 2,3-dioxygenase-like lactoylglutathione lyase family enzyme